VTQFSATNNFAQPSVMNASLYHTVYLLFMIIQFIRAITTKSCRKKGNYYSYNKIFSFRQL